MRDIFYFAIGASVLGAVFFVSLIELIYAIRRRRIHEELNAQIKEIKSSYTDSVNKLVLQEDEKLSSVETQIEAATQQIEQEKEVLKSEYEAKIEHIQEASEKAVAHAKAKAKKYEEDAKDQAKAYVDERKKEVEQELMDLVIQVTKKVLPQGITYDIQKELVMKALEDLRAEA
jgi:flagellar biosynthesis/type III secretory pathway protein FliH